MSRATSVAATPFAMGVTAGLSAWWAIDTGTLSGWLDSIISGGALLFGQAIYREADERSGGQGEA